MHKKYLNMIFIGLIFIFAAIVILHRVQLQQRYLLNDIRRNGNSLQTMLQSYYRNADRHCYPKDLVELFHSGYTAGGDRMRNPYTGSNIRVSEDHPMPFSPGYMLYVPVYNESGNRPDGYRIFMLGRTTDRFYDPEKATKWKNEYEVLTGNTGPENIVLVYTEDGVRE